ncbi:MAG: hypothetical protein JWL64_195 [Frankiales bacterium]|nr:hypothetical protein [Frankiales bacterium]
MRARVTPRIRTCIAPAALQCFSSIDNHSEDP